MKLPFFLAACSLCSCALAQQPAAAPQQQYINEAYDAGTKYEPKISSLTKRRFGPAVPAAIPSVAVIDTHNAAKLAARGDALFIFVDAEAGLNPDKAPGQGIPGSKWFPELGMPKSPAADEQAELIAKFVAAKKFSGPVVVYCESPNSWLSFNAIARLQKFGVKNIYWYRGGLLSWITSMPQQKISIFRPDSGLVWIAKEALK